VLRRTFEPIREEVTGWRKWHNEELHNQYTSPNVLNVIRSRVKWSGQLALLQTSYKISIRNPQGKRVLGRIMRKWG